MVPTVMAKNEFIFTVGKLKKTVNHHKYSFERTSEQENELKKF